MTDPNITIAGLRARIDSLLSAVHHSNRTTAERVTMFVEASSNADRLTAERDALAAQLAEARAKLDAAPKVCAIHHYEHEGPCMECGAWPQGAREWFAKLRADLASERAHLAACQTRIAGLEQAADERSAEVARLEARPVLTVERLTEAWCCAGAEIGMPNRSYVADLAGRAMRHLGLVTLLTAQDDPMRHHESRDYALQPPANGYWPADVGAVNGTEALAMGAMLRSVGPHPISDAALLAMARAAIECVDKLNAPPTSPPAARPVFAGVSEEELAVIFARVSGHDADYTLENVDDRDRAAVAAVLARLGATLVAPVDPEAVAREVDVDAAGRRSAVRAALRSRGIPVTPEVGK